MSKKVKTWNGQAVDKRWSSFKWLADCNIAYKTMSIADIGLLHPNADYPQPLPTSIMRS